MDIPEQQQPAFEPSPFPALPLPPLRPSGLLDYHGRVLLNGPVRHEDRAIWPVFAVFVSAIAATIGASFFAMAAYVAANHSQFADGDVQNGIQEMLNHPIGMLTLMASSQLGFLIVALGAAAVSPLGISKRLHLGPSKLPLWSYLVLPFGMFAISMLFNAILKALNIELGGSLQMLGTSFSEMTGSQIIAAVFVIGGLPGFAEEFLFRGYIQTRLSAHWGAVSSIFVTALLFGAMHFDKFQSPATFIMGLYLGLIAFRAGSIRPAMWCHAVNNAGSVILTWLAAHTGGTDVTESGRADVQAIVGGGVLLLCSLLVLFLTRHRRPAATPAPAASLQPLN